jgi:hypothetical protein
MGRIYSRVTCSKCQRPAWNICYIGYRVVCHKCFEKLTKEEA